MCGENGKIFVDNTYGYGSSPRVRGKPSTSTNCPTRGRLIPACAGKTSWSRGSDRPPGAHPRVCGENYIYTLIHYIYIGSSPRVRGKRIEEGAQGVVGGLIPACAGKTLLVGGVHRRVPAHPRVCGENGFHRGWSLGVSGSSPRVRGKLVGHRPRRARPGLIPACAGKTDATMVSAVTVPAHPRVCGENSMDGLVVNRETGSSPRVRGKHADPRTARAVPGLIPACAGKT